MINAFLVEDNSGSATFECSKSMISVKCPSAVTTLNTLFRDSTMVWLESFASRLAIKISFNKRKAEITIMQKAANKKTVLKSVLVFESE